MTSPLQPHHHPQAPSISLSPSTRNLPTSPLPGTCSCQSQVPALPGPPTTPFSFAPRVPRLQGLCSPAPLGNCVIWGKLRPFLELHFPSLQNEKSEAPLIMMLRGKNVRVPDRRSVTCYPLLSPLTPPPPPPPCFFLGSVWCLSPLNLAHHPYQAKDCHSSDIH